MAEIARNTAAATRVGSLCLKPDINSSFSVWLRLDRGQRLQFDNSPHACLSPPLDQVVKVGTIAAPGAPRCGVIASDALVDRAAKERACRGIACFDEQSRGTRVAGEIVRPSWRQ